MPRLSFFIKIYVVLVLLAVGHMGFGQIIMKIDSFNLAGQWKLVPNKLVKVANVGMLSLVDGAENRSSGLFFDSLSFDQSNNCKAFRNSDGKTIEATMTYLTDGIAVLVTPFGRLRSMAFLIINGDFYLGLFENYVDGKFDAPGSGVCVAVYSRIK